MEMEVGKIGNWEEATTQILMALTTPAVQVHYSGQGRKTVKGAKLNFSATFTYICLEGEKYILVI